MSILKQIKYSYRRIFCKHPKKNRGKKSFMAKDNFHFIRWETCEYCKSVLYEEII